MHTTSLQKGGLFLLFCLYLYFPVFLQLDTLPVNVWDESLFALRALHFLQEGEYMINFNAFAGMEEHMNTKLPFTTFFQVLGLKLFGINELGLRIPIALIFLSTVFYVCYYFKNHFGDIFPGIAFGAVLVSSTGFVMPHMLRTGDQDVPFACYLLLAILFFFQFVEKNKAGWLVAFAGAMIAAFLTKNLLAGLILPGLIAYAIYRRKFAQLAKDYRVYLALFTILGAYAGTVAYYEFQYPGFIERMWNYELMGRYTEEIESHSGGFFFYFKLFFQSRFRPFSYLMLISIGLLWDKNMRPDLRKLIVLSSFTFLSYLLVLSFSETKTTWYAAPLYPLGALIVAVGAYHFYTSHIRELKKVPRYAIVGLSLALLINSYSDVLARVAKPKPSMPDQKYGLFIEELADSGQEVKNFTILDNKFGGSAYFIKEEYNARDKAFNIEYQREIDFEPGELVMTCVSKAARPLKEKYDYILLHEWQECKLVKITGLKKH